MEIIFPIIVMFAFEVKYVPLRNNVVLEVDPSFCGTSLIVPDLLRMMILMIPRNGSMGVRVNNL